MENKFHEEMDKILCLKQTFSSNGILIDAIINTAIFFIKEYKTKNIPLILHEIGTLTLKYVGNQEVKKIHFLINKYLNNDIC